MIVDGMTKSRNSIPHWMRNPKDADGWATLTNDVTGVLYTSGSTTPYIYTSNDMYPKDANGTIDAILSTLRQQKSLPEILFLQLDNCGSENKSKVFYAFIASLVASGMFKTVYVNYLLVGHTHEDIDQMFSRIGIALRKNDCFTMKALIEMWKSCYSSIDKRQPIVAQHLHRVDYLSWIRPISKDLEGITGFSDTHCVEFKLYQGEVLPLFCISSFPNLSQIVTICETWLLTHLIPCRSFCGRRIDPRARCTALLLASSSVRA